VAAASTPRPDVGDRRDGDGSGGSGGYPSAGGTGGGSVSLQRPPRFHRSVAALRRRRAQSPRLARPQPPLEVRRGVARGDGRVVVVGGAPAPRRPWPPLVGDPLCWGHQ